MPNETIDNTSREKSENTGIDYYESESYQRPRAEHIMFSFEKSIGNFVQDQTGGDLQRLPPKTIDQIITESRRSEEFDNTIQWLIENSYLSTLLDLSVSAPEDADLINAAVELRRFCEHVGIFEIRNVIAHPNRQWISHYWHAVCALATHPIVVQMELKEVVEAVAAAETGGFDAPPDSWRLRVAEMEIPNNLSDVIRPTEHDAFVGRKKERSELKKRLLRRGRMSSHSIVAAGGLGKTALLLACIQDIVRDHQARSRFDRVVFLSSKSRLLTAKGELYVQADIIETQPIADQLSQTILGDDDATWEQLTEIYGDSRLLLCLDNMENILLDDPGPIEQLLMEDFPEKWTIVITSRIPVNHTSQFHLDEMTVEDKRSLSFSYSTTVGFSGISQEQIESIADRAASPLAVRICIDFLRMGHELDEAFDKTKELTSKFAYDKLMEALGENVRQLIEALYVIDEPVGSPQLASVLQGTVNGVKDAIVIATRQFLVHREDERLALHEALKEHLGSRRDDRYLSFRNSVQKKWDAFCANEQLIGGVRPGDMVGDSDPSKNYDDVEDNDLKKELYKISVLMDTRSFSANDALGTLEGLDQNVAAVHRVAAMVCRKKRDLVGARQHLQSALNLDENDWRAATLLAHTYRDSGLYQQAIDCTRSFVVNTERTAVKRVPSYSRLVYIYYTSRIWKASDQMRREISVEEAKQALDATIRETEGWQEGDPDSYRETLAGIHAMALRRSVEHAQTPSGERAEALGRALDVYGQMFDEGRTISGRPALEFQELFGQFLYLYNGADGDQHLDIVQKAVSLVVQNIDTLLTAPKARATSFRDLMARFRRVRGGKAVKDVPDEIWRKMGMNAEKEGSESDDAGGVVARIYHVPFEKSCVFAEDKEGTQYYIHASRVNPRSEFYQLSEGMHLRVWPDDSGDEHGHSAVTATRAEVGISEEIRIEERAEEDYVVTQIYRKPPGGQYLFAKDENGKDYYVASWTVEPRADFDELAEGMRLRVRPVPVGPDHPHRAVPVSIAEVFDS